MVLHLLNPSIEKSLPPFLPKISVKHWYDCVYRDFYRCTKILIFLIPLKNGYIIGQGAWPCVIIPVTTAIKMKGEGRNKQVYISRTGCKTIRDELQEDMQVG